MSRSKIPPVFRIFKGGGPRDFSYQPRYYDQDKEEREQRRREIEEQVKKEKGQGGHDAEGFRERMRASWKNQEVRGETMRANIRLLIILVLLCLFVWIIFLYLERI